MYYLIPPALLLLFFLYGKGHKDYIRKEINLFMSIFYAIILVIVYFVIGVVWIYTSQHK